MSIFEASNDVHWYFEPLLALISDRDWKAANNDRIVEQLMPAMSTFWDLHIRVVGFEGFDFGPYRQLFRVPFLYLGRGIRELGAGNWQTKRSAQPRKPLTGFGKRCSATTGKENDF